MRYLTAMVLLTTVVLSGCANFYDDHNNITQVTLSPSEQQTVSADISHTLFAAMGQKPCLISHTVQITPLRPLWPHSYDAVASG